MSGEKILEDRIDDIERAEQRIEKEEKRILEVEKDILKSVKDQPIEVFSVSSGESKHKIHLFRTVIVKKIVRHKLIFAIISTVALVLIWRGTWHIIDEIPFLNISIVSLLVGIFIIWAFKKYTDMH